MKLALSLVLVAAGLSGCDEAAPVATGAVSPSPTLASPLPVRVKARPRRRTHLPAASRSLRRSATGTHKPTLRPTAPWSVDWQAISECESGGDWHINSGNSYYGGLQESLTFWSNYGGPAFAARPDLATRDQQITVAERGLEAEGIGAWPICQEAA